MKHAIAIMVLLLVSISAHGQARTAENIVSITFSRLNEGNPQDGSVRTLINGTPGSTPCAVGSVKVFAIKLNGVWNCPNLGSGAGTGDVTGPGNSAVGELPLFTTTTGKILGRSNTLSGIVSLSSGLVSVLQSSGTGDVARVAGAALTGLNASTVFGSGTVPPARIISNALTPNTCLRLSSTGAIETAAADCGVGGGGGVPGGVSGNLQYNNAGVLAGLLNTSYNSGTGVITLNQQANGNDMLIGSRASDSSPTGTWLRLRNLASTSDLFSVGVTGQVYSATGLLLTTIAAPATPATGNLVTWADLTDKNLKAQDDTGQVTLTVRATACSGTDKVSGISSAGVVTCTADQGGSGTGVITLNTLNTSDQSFVAVDDANIDLAITSSVSTHTFTVSWVGTLAKARQHIATVYSDAANTWTTGAQSFAAATSLTLPTAAGAAPTANASIAYDSTSNTLEAGINGTNRTFAFTAGSQTFSDKTLDNSTTASLRDTLLTLQDNADSTKTVNFELGGITSGQNRVVTVVDAASMTVRPNTATTNQWVTHIDSSGVQQKAQPTFANISGTMGETQGGTGQTAYAQGDLLYASTTNVLSRLPKSTAATRYLSNTGASNNPAWAQVDLTNGVTGVLPVANWSILTAKGDLLTHNGTATVRLPAGTDGLALFADSTVTAGVKWAAVTATAGGSTTQLQRNSTGTLGGISGATSNGTSVTFADGALVLNGGDYGASDESLPGSPTEKSFYLNTNASSRRLYVYNNAAYRALFQAGVDQVNLASDNVTGILPLANGGTNQTTWTASRCVQVNSAGTALESASAACGSGGGSGTVTVVASGSLTSTALVTGGGTTTLQTPSATATLDASGNMSLPGSLTLTASGAGYAELAEGTAPAAVANRVTVAAPTDVQAGGWVLSLPTTPGSSGQFLQTNGSGVTVWSTPSGSGDVVGPASATDEALTRFDGTTGKTIQDSAITLSDAGALTFPDNVRQTFNPGANVAGVNVGAIAGDPDTPSNGDLWYDSTANELTARINGANVALGAGGGGGANTALSNLASVAINTTLASDTDLTDDLGTSSIRWKDSWVGGVIIGGKSVTTDADNSVGILSGSVTYAKNDTNTRTFYGSLIKPILNTGGSNTNTILNVLAVDTTNTATTGLTTNLLNLAYGGSTKLTVASDGSLVLAGTGGGYIQFTEGTPPGIVANTVQHAVVTDAPAAGTQYLWGATAGSGILRVANSSGVMAVTQDAGISHLASSTSADLRGALSDETGTGAAVFVAGNIGAGSATTATANDNTTLIATTAYVQTELTAYAADTKALTNTTVDPEATGNVIGHLAKVNLWAAGCQNTTAASFWDLPTSTPAVAACVTGANVQKGVLQFADTAGGFSAQTHFELPEDFTGTIDAKIVWRTSATSGNAKWSLSTICTAVDATETDDPAFNTASTVTTTAAGVANRLQTSSITSVTITGCAAGEVIHVKLFRDGNDAADTIATIAEVVNVQLTIRRSQ